MPPHFIIPPGVRQLRLQSNEIAAQRLAASCPRAHHLEALLAFIAQGGNGHDLADQPVVSGLVKHDVVQSPDRASGLLAVVEGDAIAAANVARFENDGIETADFEFVQALRIFGAPRLRPMALQRTAST